MMSEVIVNSFFLKILKNKDKTQQFLNDNIADIIQTRFYGFKTEHKTLKLNSIIC